MQTMTRRERREAADRHERVTEACASERKRFNAAIRPGYEPILQTFIGPQHVVRVTHDWWYQTREGRSWCGCNDGDWANMMAQLGLARDREFIAFSWA